MIVLDDGDGNDGDSDHGHHPDSPLHRACSQHPSQSAGQSTTFIGEILKLCLFQVRLYTSCVIQLLVSLIETLETFIAQVRDNEHFHRRMTKSMMSGPTQQTQTLGQVCPCCIKLVPDQQD